MEQAWMSARLSINRNNMIWYLIVRTFYQADELARISLVCKSWYHLSKQVPRLRLELHKINVVSTNPTQQTLAMEKLSLVICSTLKLRSGLVELEIIDELSRTVKITATELMDEWLAPSMSTLQKLVLGMRLKSYEGFFQSISSSLPILHHLETKFFPLPSRDELMKIKPDPTEEHLSMGRTRIQVLNIRNLNGAGNVVYVLCACPELRELVVRGDGRGLINGRNLETVEFGGKNVEFEVGSLQKLSKLTVISKGVELRGEGMFTSLTECCLEKITTAMFELVMEKSPRLEKVTASVEQRAKGVACVRNSGCLTVLHFKDKVQLHVSLHVTGCRKLRDLNVNSAINLVLDEESVSHLENLYMIGVFKPVLPKSLPCLKRLLVNGFAGDIEKTVLAPAGSCLVNLFDWERISCTAVSEWSGRPAKRVKFSPSCENPPFILLKKDELRVEVSYSEEDDGCRSLIGVPSSIMREMEGVEEISIACIEGDDEVCGDELDELDDEAVGIEALKQEVQPGFCFRTEKNNMIFTRSRKN